MFVAESRRSRRYVGRLDKGEELCGALRALCQARDVRAGEIRASGLVSAVELVPYDREGKGYTSPRRLRAFFELVRLHGTIAMRDGEPALHLTAVLARDNQDRGGGIDLLGGLLVAADVVTCEFVLEVFEDLSLQREFDPAVGVHVLADAETLKVEGEAPRGSGEPRPTTPPAASGSAATSPPQPSARAPEPKPAAPKPAPVAPKPAPTPVRAPAPLPPKPMPPRPTYHAEAAEDDEPRGAPSTTAPGTSWADAIRRSAEIETPQNEMPLKPGDLLDHPKFGRVEVLRVDEGEERISVRLGSGRFIELGLEVLHLEHVRTEGTRELYKVHTSRR